MTVQLEQRGTCLAAMWIRKEMNNLRNQMYIQGSWEKFDEGEKQEVLKRRYDRYWHIESPSESEKHHQTHKKAIGIWRHTCSTPNEIRKNKENELYLEGTRH